MARIADAPRVQGRVLDGFVEDQELNGADKVERELVRLRAEDLRREDRIEDGRHGAVELQVDGCSLAVVQREEQYRVKEKRRAVADEARVPVERSREQGRPRLNVLEKASFGRGKASVGRGLLRHCPGEPKTHKSNSASHSSYVKIPLLMTSGRTSSHVFGRAADAVVVGWCPSLALDDEPPPRSTRPSTAMASPAVSTALTPTPSC